MTISRRRVGVLAALAAAAAITLSAGAIGAAEPPPDAEPTTGPVEPPANDGVVLDATVTITFTAGEAAFGSDAGAPLEGATVSVTASADGEWAGEWTAETDAGGVATLEGVARADPGGPEVTLAVSASWQRATEREDGCLDIEVFAADDTVSAAAVVDVALAGAATATVECPEPTPTPVLGIAWDASLEVTVTDDGGLPIGAADVALTATQGTPDEAGDGAFFKTAGTTEADGTVTLTDLPRALEEADAQPVTWEVVAWAFPFEIVDGCALGSELRANATIEDPVAGIQALALTADAADPGWGSCEEPGEDAPVVTVVAIGLPDAPGGSGDVASAEPGASGGSGADDGTGDITATAVTGEWVRVTQTRADGATWESGDVALEGGTAEVRVQAWGTASDPSTLVVAVQGPYLRSETDDDCMIDVVLAGEATVEAAFSTDPPARIEVELAETRVATGCAGSTEPPAVDTGAETGDGTNDAGAAVTPPPTDASVAPVPGARPLAAVLSMLLAIAVVALAGVLAVRSGRRTRRP